MNNDLISREALKKALIEAHINRVLTFDIATFNCVMSTIDNAPTVEPEKVVVANFSFDKDELDQIVRDRVIEPIKNGELVIKEEKPQDKWGKWVITEIRCPICLEYFQTDCYSTEDLNECPNCGADIRGEDHD